MPIVEWLIFCTLIIRQIKRTKIVLPYGLYTTHSLYLIIWFITVTCDVKSYSNNIIIFMCTICFLFMLFNTRVYDVSILFVFIILYKNGFRVEIITYFVCYWHYTRQKLNHIGCKRFMNFNKYNYQTRFVGRW